MRLCIFCVYTISFFIAKIKPTKLDKEMFMEHKITELLIRIAHLSEKMKSVSDELDKIYKSIGDTLKIEIFAEFE